MKLYNKHLLILLMTVGFVSTFISCKKEETAGTPSISYVRVTRPESSDSLLVGAGQGQLIAIVGNNLQDAVEIWFNDQQARLTPSYITNTSILVSVPAQIPSTVNNTLKIIFKNGTELLHNFQVQISKPVITSMLSEFVNEGDIATINGNFFYEPTTVTFTGGATGTIVSRKDRELKVKVPAGAQPGPITIKTNFGEAKSNFWFRDNRNIFIDSDPFEGWWNAAYVVSSPGPNDPPKINGNYIRVKKTIGAWTWTEVAGGPNTAMSRQSKNIPDAAILKPEEYYLKFEVNTIKPYTATLLRINLALNAEDNDAYFWKAPYDTKGQWETITIPLEEIFASYKVKPSVNPNGYWTRLLIFGGTDFDADIAFDNFRVVPKVSK